MLSKMDRMTHAYQVPTSTAARPNPLAPSVPFANPSPDYSVGTGYTQALPTVSESDDTGSQGNYPSNDAVPDDSDVNRQTVRTEGYATPKAASNAIPGQAPFSSIGSDNTKKLVIVGIAILGVYLIMK